MIASERTSRTSALKTSGQIRQRHSFICQAQGSCRWGCRNTKTNSASRELLLQLVSTQSPSSGMTPPGQHGARWRIQRRWDHAGAGQHQRHLPASVQEYFLTCYIADSTTPRSQLSSKTNGDANSEFALGMLHSIKTTLGLGLICRMMGWMLTRSVRYPSTWV